MAVKSIISVDIDDSKFQRFQTLFGRYQEQLAKTPGLWAKAGEKQSEIGSHFEKMAAAMLSVNQINRETGDDADKQVKTLSLSEKLWSSIGRTTKDTAKNILGATESLLKWTGVLGAVSGVLGFGGLFGIDRMAAHVANDRRSSSGLGLSIGSMKAFRQGPGQLLDADPFLNWVNSMELDVTKQAPAWSLLHHGLGSDTGENAVQLMDAIRALARSRPLNQVGSLLHNSYGLDMSDDSIRRLAQTPDKEYNERRDWWKNNKGVENIEDKTAKAWQDLVMQLEKASTQIYNTFVVALKPLAPALAHLSSAFVELFEHLGKSAVVKEAIDNFAHWMESFSAKVASEKFLSAVDSFMGAAGEMARVLHFLAHPFDTTVQSTGGMFQDVAEWFQPTKESVTRDKDSTLNYLARKDSKYGLPEGTFAKIWNAESGQQLYPHPSGKGAIGPMQLMPDTAKQFGVNPWDPVDNINAGTDYFHQQVVKYKGDLAKAAAAYNWGPENLDRELAAYAKTGKDWFSGLPKETQGYVTDKLGFRPSGTDVNIYNNTGGSATVTVNGLQH